MNACGKLFAVTTALAVSLPACSVTQDGAPLERAGDRALLAELIQRIRDGEFTDIHSVLVLVNDTLVVEEYFDGYDAGTPHQLRSATKAIGSMLVGIAIDKGLLSSEDDSIYRYFEEEYRPAYGWTDAARAIRIRDLLSMTSGYDCDDLATPAFACEDAMYETDDWVQYALDLPIVHAPGERWAYNSASLILVGQAIARMAATSLAAFAERQLFAPLGVMSFEWAISPGGHAWVGGGARATPRDMLKIGQLMLHRGMWGDRRLLSERWVETSTRPQAEYHAGVEYGYIWQIGAFFQAGELVPAYWASGNGGQYIVIFPDHDMVAVSTGGNYDSPLADQPFEMIDDYVLPALLGTAAPPTTTPSKEELERVVGVYHLDFAPEATCTVDVDETGVSVMTPDGERVELRAHSPLWFSGDSQHGTINLVFEQDRVGRATRLTVYGHGSRFVFERIVEEG
jgi:CubicO group peptidase (beta-lactamase class C family)